ncbi:MAG: polyketide cyclase [Treponema sp.]|nr:polyketide cyclase [Treponema sp.]
MCARTTATIKKLLHSDIHRVWHIVTSLDEYTWRSTIHTIERVNNSTADTVGKQFVEYDATGYATTFTITAVVPYARWELDMENDNIKGHWIGIFTQCGEQTEISFTEHVVAKKILLKPFIKSYLKKQQAQYVADLEKELAARRRL